MSDLNSSLILGFGKHASATDFSSSPTFYHLLPEKFDGFRSPDAVRLAREPAHPQNKRFAPLRGPIDMAKSHSVEFILRGLSGNNGGAIDPETTNDVAKLLDVIFGTDSIDPADAVTTATGGTGASKTLTVTEQARFPVGMVIMFQAPAGTYHVRQVRSRAGSSGAGDLTLDRTYSGAVDNGSNVIRFARWKEDPSVHEHTHGAFFAEWANDRRLFVGGMSRAQLDFSVGQYARLITSWQFTNVTDAAESNPSFSEQTTGSGLVNMNNSFWVGDTTFYATEMKVDLGGSLVARKANSGPHGVQGYTVQKGAGAPKPKIMVRLQRGTNSGEIADSSGTPSFNALQGWDLDAGEAFGSLDIAFQVGTVAGACGYVVAQNAACVKAEEVVVDGYKHIDCEFECNGPSDTSFGPLELHLG